MRVAAPPRSMASSAPMLHELEKAVVLGVVEGVTEFLPVSSTGHLILFGSALNFTGEVEKSFEIFIQSGAILAIVLLYWRRFKGLFNFSSPADGFSGWTGIQKLVVACLPAFVLGALLHNVIRTYLFTPTSVALAFIVGAVLIFYVENRRGPSTVISVSDISLRQAFCIGLLQCAALWPGMSRSGSTILAGMWLGLERRVAAEFSFLVGVPVLTAAAAFDLLKSWRTLSTEHLQLFGVGFVVAALSALLAVRVFVALIGRWSLRPFGVYRLVVGILILGSVFLAA